jgi:hypothetical protein
MIYWGIFLQGLASGEPHSHCPGWVKYYDPTYVRPEGYDGGILEITQDPNEALWFPTAAEAFAKWKQQAPPPYDIRPDGQPNRPLTAFTATIDRIPYVRQTQAH